MAVPADDFEVDGDGADVDWGLLDDLPWRDGDEIVAEARRLRERGDHRAALRRLDDVEGFDADFERGVCHEATGDLEAAAAAYRRCGRARPTAAHAWNNLGVVLHALGRHEEADAAFGRCGSASPQATVNRILTLAELGRHDEAEQAFYLAQFHDDRDGRAFFNVAHSLAMRGRWERAAYCLRRALEVDGPTPAVPPAVAHFRLAEAMAALANPRAARRHFGRSAAACKAGDPLLPEALARLADAQLDAGDPAAAGPVVRRLAKLTPDAPAARALLGRLALADGDAAAAERHLLAAVAGDPTCPRVHLMLARLAIGRGDRMAATRHLRAELLRHGRDHGDTAALAEAAEVFLELGEPAGAAAALRKLVARRPGDARVWQKLGAAECEANRLVEGLAATRKSIDLDPGHAPAWHNLALALHHRGDRDAARAAVRQGLKLAPDHLPLRRLRWRLRLRRLLGQ